MYGPTLVFIFVNKLMRSVSDALKYTKENFDRLITIPYINYDFTKEPPQTFTQPLTFGVT